MGLKEKVGTLNYMAPEIHLNQEYDGKKVDLFAAAIILFIMVSEHPPFTAARPDDPFHRCLAANRSDIFWKTHLKEKTENFYSEDFKDLVQGLLALDPLTRPTIEQILEHPWMQGDTPSKDDIVAEFAERKKKVDAQAKEEKEEKSGGRSGGKVMRSGGAGAEEAKIVEESKEQKPLKELIEYD